MDSNKSSLPPGWIIKTFSKCIEKEASSNKLKIPQKDFKESGKFAIVDQSMNFIAGYTDNSQKVYDGELPVVIFGDHTRIFKYVDFPFSLGADGTKILVPRKDILVPKYFYFFLKGLRIESHGYSRHFKFLKEKEITIPPLENQKKIVAILEKAEMLKEWRKEADALTDEYLKSVFLEMFGDPVRNPKGWDLKPISDGVNRLYNGANFTKNDYLDNGIPVISKGDIKTNMKMIFDKKELKYVSEEYVVQNKLKYAQKNDLIIATRDLSIKADFLGLVGIVNGNENYVLNQGCSIIDINRNYFSKEYLAMLSNTNYYRAFVKKNMIGSTQVHLRIKSFLNFIVPHPPIEEQEKFSGIVDGVEQMRGYQKQSKQQIENLFDTLMQKAFRGELAC